MHNIQKGWKLERVVALVVTNGAQPIKPPVENSPRTVEQPRAYEVDKRGSGGEGYEGRKFLWI